MESPGSQQGVRPLSRDATTPGRQFSATSYEANFSTPWPSSIVGWAHDSLRPPATSLLNTQVYDDADPVLRAVRTRQQVILFREDRRARVRWVRSSDRPGMDQSSPSP